MLPAGQFGRTALQEFFIRRIYAEPIKKMDLGKGRYKEEMAHVYLYHL